MLATLSDERDLGDGLGAGAQARRHPLPGLRARRPSSRCGRARGNALAFPAITAALEQLGHDAIIDGEVVATDAGAAHRSASRPCSAARGRRAPSPCGPSTCRGRGAEDLRDRPLFGSGARCSRSSSRRAAPWRERDARPARRAPPTSMPAPRAGRASSPSGPTALPRRRSRDWLKLKCLFEQEMVIGGFTEPQRSRVGLGALLVGYHDDVARCATPARSGPASTSPPCAPCARASTRWRSPRRRSASRSSRCPRARTGSRPSSWRRSPLPSGPVAGRLRQPRFLGLREDKRPSETSCASARRRPTAAEGALEAGVVGVDRRPRVVARRLLAAALLGVTRLHRRAEAGDLERDLAPVLGLQLAAVGVQRLAGDGGLGAGLSCSGGAPACLTAPTDRAPA